MNITRKITLGGLFIALSIILPQTVHLLGSAELGRILLPMHIPVLLSGFVIGPFFGLLIGAISPVLSYLITGMPPLHRLIFMIAELAGYGLMSGLLYRNFKLYKNKYGAVISLIGAMVFGRLVNVILLFIAADLLNISKIGVIAVLEAAATGIIGIIIQIIFIPTIIYFLNKSEVINISKRSGYTKISGD
jgi:LytS/YehU family sensor histidine kinase